MIASLVAGLVLTSTLPDSEAVPGDYSEWIQHACQIQQVGYNGGGVPSDYVEFCTCFDGQLREDASPAIYRIFALGSQGALREQSLIEDWAGARDTAAAEAAALPPAEQGQIQPVLQGALGVCFSSTGQAN